MSDERRKTLCVDFDGVLHSYGSGWQGAAVIPDPPVPGAIEWLAAAVERFNVCIFSSRSGQEGGIAAMRSWLYRHRLSSNVLDRIEFPTEKPAAHMSIDDRGFCFEGTWPDLDLVERFKPWNKREFPRGHAALDDQGELSLKVGSAGGTVRIDFGKPVRWLGMGATEARGLAELLLQHAEAAEN